MEEAMVATRDAGRLASHHGQQALQGPGQGLEYPQKALFQEVRKKEVKRPGVAVEGVGPGVLLHALDTPSLVEQTP